VFKPGCDSAYRRFGERDRRSSVRGALRNRGYFKITATAKLTYHERRGRHRCCCGYLCHARTAIPIGRHRIDPRIAFGPLVNRPRSLRDLIPLQRGELSVSKKSDLVCKTSRWPRARGLRGYDPEPDTEVDEDRKTVDLVVKSTSRCNTVWEALNFWA